MNRRRFIQLMSAGAVGTLFLSSQKSSSTIYIDWDRQVAWISEGKLIVLRATPHSIREV